MPQKRKCLPSREREVYIAAMSQAGYGRITIGCKNRYIDEFLRFCAERFAHSDAKRVTRRQVQEFAEHLSDSMLTLASARTKIGELLAWFHWLEEHDIIEESPTSQLVASSLLRKTQRAR